ncbi:MAG: sensor histidine kinase, partial [Candidatus Dojkabacteria bacterium]
MEIEIVILVFISALTLSFGVNILKKKTRTDKRQLLLFSVIFSQFAWVVTNLLTLVFYNIDYWNLILTRSSFAAAAIISICFLTLINEISQPRNKLLVWLFIIIQMSWIPLSFTGLVVDSVLAGDLILRSTDGNLKLLYSITLALTFIYSFRLLYISYTESNNVNFKHQIKYILFGGITSLVLTFISSLIFPVFGVELRSLGPMAMMIFVGSTFYAVTQHRFLRLNIAIGSVVSFALLSTIPLGTFFLVYEINTRLWGSIYSLPAILSGFGEAILFILIFQKLQTAFRNLLNRNINSDYLRTKKLIDSFENQISKDIDQESIYNKTQSLLDQSMNLPRFTILQLEKDSLIQILSKGKNPNFLHKIIPILKWTDKHEGRYVDLTESQEINDNFYDILIDLEIETIFPIDKKRFFVLFSKSDNQIYTVYEIEFLLRITQILGISLQRADLYQKQKEFSETLKKEVESATKEISQQKELIQRKYEEERDMIGILGHELGTALTVAKNINELLMSRVNLMKKENIVDYDYILDKVNTVNDSLLREANIVETTLSTSRIDNNKAEIVNQPVDIVDIIQYAIDAHRPMALKTGLSLIYEKPEFKVPIFTSDSAKVQEIVTNLVSNAVKYTFKGYVKAKLDIDDEYIYFSVEDSGEGIPKELLSKLGQKFYRV